MKLALLSLAAAVGIAANADAAVTLKIRNLSGQQVWVQWTNNGSLAGTTGGFPIQQSTAYDLSTFTTTAANEYEIAGYGMGGGRMWFTFGSQALNFSNGQPSLANFIDPNFALRYDWIEGLIIGSVDDNVNTTAVDKFGIPISVAGYNSTNQAGTLQVLKSELGRRVYSPLSAIAANASAGPPASPANATPQLSQITGNSPYLVVNSNSQGITPAPGYTGYQYSPIGQTGSFVRVIGNDNIVGRYVTSGGVYDPVTVANNNAPPANYLWRTYDKYVQMMETYSGTTTLAGLYSPSLAATDATTATSNYSLTTTWSSTEQRTLTYDSGALVINFTGFVTLKGTVTVPSGTYAGTYTTEIKVPYGGLPKYYSVQAGTYHYAFMLDPTGVVGANANYLYKFYTQGSADPGFSQTDPLVNGPGNNVLTQIVGDLLAGMNLGAVGSTVTLPQAVTINGTSYAKGTAVGSMPSQAWFGLGAALLKATGGTGSVYDYYFGYLQSSDEYYNKWAETVYPLSDAYGFAYSDRIQGGTVSVSWDGSPQSANPLDTIVITILPDGRLGPNGGRLGSDGGGRIEAVEYHNESLKDYHVTWLPDEIAKLDSGAIKGWTRTGRWFNAFSSPQPGTTPVCRLYLPPAQGDSHFLGRNAAECASAAAVPGVVVEDPAFLHMYLPVNGACPANSSPVYRLFSNRADTSHRYVTDTGTRTQMQVRGWVAEGDGPQAVTMCEPD